jgi:hypothetical protein
VASPKGDQDIEIQRSQPLSRREPQFPRGAHGVHIIGGFIKYRRAGVAPGVVVLKRDGLRLGQRSHYVCFGNVLNPGHSLESNITT